MLIFVQDGDKSDHMDVDGSKQAADGHRLEMCFIRLGTAKKVRVRPKEKAQVKLRCPKAVSGNGKCASDPYTWMCSKCNIVVEYGIKEKLFYCNCGESDPRMSQFRCSDKDHGKEYIRYEDTILTAELAKLKAIQEMNILILGETGVGKSTWINGFINYMTFEDLEEARKVNEPRVLIPSKFTIIYEEKEKEIVIGGTDANENFTVGQSATNAPRTYVFDVAEGSSKTKIRLIDTPGIGDGKGIHQDKQNFDNILSYLTNYDEIHAVCILLKPNNARLTAMFRFCIQELLAHLHSSAKHNIVFCFTNARATFYKPGDTLPALNKELADKKVGIKATPKNYFCFDNEPFRFLASLMNGISFPDEDIESYSKSWNKSVEETKKLFDYIKQLRPHPIRNTINMNEARRIILAMGKPLAEVTKTIERNVQEGEEAKKQIDSVNTEMDSLKKHLEFSGFGLKQTCLNYPMTVCTDIKCIDHIPVGKSRAQNVVYKQICHDHCYLKGIPTETPQDERLINCSGILGLRSMSCLERRKILKDPSRGRECARCGHHYRVHMHITYKIDVVEEKFLSDEVQTQITEKKTVKAKKESFKQAIDIKIAELKEEQEIIMKTSAKYGSFLKANALIPYNDAVGDYLDMSIKLEQQKSKEIRNEDLCKTMESMKKSYEEERRMLDEAIGTSHDENIKTPEEVAKLQADLFSLKHMGPTLMDFFEQISIANSARNIQFKETVQMVNIRLRRRVKNRLVSWLSKKI